MNTPFSRDDVKILIVEDSPTQAEKLRYILEQHQYEISVVRNGREALAAIERERPTLVLSDIIMPEMDGYELCRRIKQGETSRRIPVILLTSLTDPTDVVKGLESGADSFIFKPYDEQYLIARIAYTLANQHLRESEYPQMGVEIYFADRKFFITSDRLQILNLLLSTYEAAVQKNRELATTQDELRHLNENLETKVDERTAALEVEIAERRQAQGSLQAQLQRLNLLHQITRAIGERQDLQSVYQAGAAEPGGQPGHRLRLRLPMRPKRRLADRDECGAAQQPARSKPGDGGRDSLPAGRRRGRALPLRRAGLRAQYHEEPPPLRATHGGERPALAGRRAAAR